MVFRRTFRFSALLAFSCVALKKRLSNWGGQQMKISLITLSLLYSVFAFAEKQTYVLHDPTDESINEHCVTQYIVDSDDDLAKVVLAKQRPKILDSKPIETSTHTRPGDSEGKSIKVFTRVFLIHQDLGPEYKGGVYSRLQIFENGKGKDRGSFSVTSELLNHRLSVDLVEASVCTELTYILWKPGF